MSVGPSSIRSSLKNNKNNASGTYNAKASIESITIIGKWKKFVDISIILIFLIFIILMKIL